MTARELGPEWESDIAIARKQNLVHIYDIASQLGLNAEDLFLHGPTKAKISMPTMQGIFSENRLDAPLILVSSINPTDAGEGKTTCSIGLSQAINQLGSLASVALREPSMGPAFGRKGGAAGGGYSQVLPMEEINLHFTGDFHAISAAHNLIAATLDNQFHFGNAKRLKPERVLWKRVMDMNDRALRRVTLQGSNSEARESGFEITPASEIMAILCLSSSYSELKDRISRIVVALDENDNPVRVQDLNIQGATGALLKEAMLPNLVQTLEQTPAFIHGGPFANIAQGANSVLATKLALKLSDYVVTEAGFGFDLGAEKFFNIVSRYGEFTPSAVVLVVTSRSLKMHGGIDKATLEYPNAKAVRAGGENLKKHLESAKSFGVPVFVAINLFLSDTEEELAVIEAICREQGVESSRTKFRTEGGGGGLELAEKVIQAADTSKPENVQYTYEWSENVEEKIAKIARQIYGAKDVEFGDKAKADLNMIYEQGFNKLPICMAKSHQSLSDNPKALGRPKDFTIHVREIIVSAGAGILVPVTGTIMRMPGLPATPVAEQIQLDEQGYIQGLF